MGIEHLQRKVFANAPEIPILAVSQPVWTDRMNAPTDIAMKSDDVLRVELEVFRREHRDLDEAIHALVEKGIGDQLTLQRLKKKKLRLKDMIAYIEDRLYPDIIA
jgi:hypothetical protein